MPKKVTKSRNVKGTKKIKHNVTELMDTETELKDSISLSNYSHHKYELKKNYRYDVGIYKPSPTYSALLSNKAPRIFHLFSANYFHPTSSIYLIVSIYYAF